MAEATALTTIERVTLVLDADEAEYLRDLCGRQPSDEIPLHLYAVLADLLGRRPIQEVTVLDTREPAFVLSVFAPPFARPNPWRSRNHLKTYLSDRFGGRPVDWDIVVGRNDTTLDADDFQYTD
jgi:hypothetical protein